MIYSNSKIKNILLLGNGSIGSKHKSIINKLRKNIKIKIINSDKEYLNYNLMDHDPDLVVVASPTYTHLKYLKDIDKKLKKKIILVEKPLFNKHTNFKKNLNNKNKIFVAYNLRFHPIIQFIKNFLKGKKVFFAKSFCMSYLPNWRKKNYKKTYSASRKFGGGVSLDLSHELDYLTWLLGEIKIIFRKSSKISNLKIKSDDVFNLIGKTTNNLILNLTLSYASRVEKRVIIIDGNTFSLYGDLNKGFLEIKSKNNTKKIKFKSVDQKNTIELMYKYIFKEKYNYLCTMRDGNKILKII